MVNVSFSHNKVKVNCPEKKKKEIAIHCKSNDDISDRGASNVGVSSTSILMKLLTIHSNYDNIHTQTVDGRWLFTMKKLRRNVRLVIYLLSSSCVTIRI
uniref:Uncharacterized protein n=1 Tax=Octopus bimaculoides TaxID=37653 RepID=A0A0L8HKZ6_OCTBM